MSEEITRIEDHAAGFSIAVPLSWKVLKKEAFAKFGFLDPNTIFAIILPDGNRLVINNGGRCSAEQLDEAYQLNIDTMKQAGHNVSNETVLQSNSIIIKRAFVDISRPDGGMTRVCQNYTIINDHLVNFTAKADPTIDSENTIELANQPIARDIYNLIMSVQTF